MMLLSAAPVSPDRLAEGVTRFGPCIAQSWGQAESPFLLTYLAPEVVASAAEWLAPTSQLRPGHVLLAGRGDG